MVALVAHSVVARAVVQLHSSEATGPVDKINATTTASSASTQAGRRPNPCRWATAEAALHPSRTSEQQGCVPPAV